MGYMIGMRVPNNKAIVLMTKCIMNKQNKRTSSKIEDEHNIKKGCQHSTTIIKRNIKNATIKRNITPW
jgi:hypothetical protein